MDDLLSRRGLIFILSSPSGAGKSTLARHLRKEVDNIFLSVSATTRARRPSEIEGVHYIFKTPAQFQAMVDAGRLLEWAHVHGNDYGTPIEPVEAALTAGRDVLFDIDWQGTRQVYQTHGDDTVSVFVLPPDLSELRRRLERRAEDAPETIAQRLENARSEMQHWNEYDYVLINDDLDRTFNDVVTILRAERLARKRFVRMGEFIEGLRREEI